MILLDGYKILEKGMIEMNLEDSGVWFAWYPVQLSDGDWIWLENVYWERDFMAMKSNEYLGLAENEYIYTKIEE